MLCSPSISYILLSVIAPDVKPRDKREDILSLAIAVPPFLVLTVFVRGAGMFFKFTILEAAAAMFSWNLSSIVGI